MNYKHTTAEKNTITKFQSDNSNICQACYCRESLAGGTELDCQGTFVRSTARDQAIKTKCGFTSSTCQVVPRTDSTAIPCGCEAVQCVERVYLFYIKPKFVQNPLK